ncbi:MAG: hypothetical protein QOK31_2034 [Solirubrobacteraceae bacterium]|jgi:hypothetical protein|nr:hypothetical protein [Solirubrobacteraceae bacterium]
MDPVEPYRAAFGAPRPERLRALPLPPGPMPGRRGSRPLKAWRWIGVFSDELMLCAARVRIGPLRQVFWAVWDRESRVLHEHTVLRPSKVVGLSPGRLRVADREVEIDLAFAEQPGIETVCPHGAQYAWTRKQAGIEASGSVRIGERVRSLAARAVIDDSAGYHARHTAWCWSAGVGVDVGGRAVGWNLVEGINDPPRGSERTVWVDGAATEIDPVEFAPDLSRIGDLRFEAETTRQRRDDLLVLRSDYRQPFGTFRGTLPGGVELAEGLGVMESHNVRW